MKQFFWDTPENLRTLLCELVSWDSRTLTEGERTFALKLEEKLKELDYFRNHSHHLELHDAGHGRQTVTALYKHPEAKETIVLLSHFDTVQTEEYGVLEPFAFDPEKLTKKLFEYKEELHEEARIDLESGAYLFGRGTMDMKMGLALHMALIEKASIEKWPINLLLTTVPDEEVNSAGMRVAVKELVRLRSLHSLSYKLFLNSEPTFSQQPGDSTGYIYTGSIGKILPAALFYGKETHVGEPLSGITANYIASFLTQKMEWNPLFRETDFGETAPLPVSLQQKDLKKQYSTQTPYRGAALYNVFLFKRNAAEVMDLFEQVTKEAMEECNISYKKICEREQVEAVGELRVIRYEELVSYAEEKLGIEEVDRMKITVLENIESDDREMSFEIVDNLMLQCQELAPATVIFYAPPYYPAVNSSHETLVQESVKLVKKESSRVGLGVERVHYFNGISDLSYVNYTDNGEGWSSFERNTPLWGEVYTIPFLEMAELKSPVFNVGPFGKDAHQRTERLGIQSAFVETPYVLEKLVKSMF